jgi:hypothetical protein
MVFCDNRNTNKYEKAAKGVNVIASYNKKMIKIKVSAFENCNSYL